MKKIFYILLVIPFFLMIYPTSSLAVEKASINEEIIYNIFVDRFNNGKTGKKKVELNDPYAYHGGDLKGITKKLEDIKQLGFTTISLSPIMANAAKGYHGYWIEDYFRVEEEFGTMQDLQHLVSEAHKREMKVVVEFVPGFVAKTSPLVSEKAAWMDTSKQFDTKKNPWLENVVALDTGNPEVISYLQEVADFWVEEANIDGYSLYAADETSPQFLNAFTSHLKEKHPQFMILASTITNQGDEKLREIEGIDLVDNKVLQQALFSSFAEEGKPVEEIIDSWENNGKPYGLIAIDDPFSKRFTHEFSEHRRNILTAWKLALTYMYTTPGVPIIYQGSEIPMYGSGYPESQHLVEFNSGDSDLKEFYTRISSLRTSFPALQYGDFEKVAQDKGMSVYKRTYEGETIYIAINNDPESRAVSIKGIGNGLQLRGLLGDNLAREDEQGEYKIGIPRESSEVYIIEENTGLNWVFIAPILVVMLLFVTAIVYLGRKEKQRNHNSEK